MGMDWESDFDMLMSGVNDITRDSFASPLRQYPRNGRPGGKDDVISLMPVSDFDVEKDPSLKGNSGTEVMLKPEPEFRMYNKRHVKKWSEKEMEEIRASCEGTIVHDYSEFDFYHISDDARAELDTLSEIRAQLSGLKTIYHRVDQYVEAMRIVFVAIELLEKKMNYVLSKDEFYEKIGAGTIYPTGFPIPQLHSLSKYDDGLLETYIANPSLNAADLLSEEERRRIKAMSRTWADDDEDEEEDEETPEEKIARLLGLEYAEELEQYRLSHEQIKVDSLDDKFIAGYSDGRTFFGKERRKKFKDKGKQTYSKAIQALFLGLENSPRFTGDDYVNSNYRRHNSIMTSGLFEPKEEIKNPIDGMRFFGSFADTDAFWFYEQAMDNKIADSVVPGQSYITHQGVSNQKVFNMLEKLGMNMTEFRRGISAAGVSRDENIKENRERNKKLESRLVARIIAMNGDKKFKKLAAKAEEEAALVEKDGMKK